MLSKFPNSTLKVGAPVSLSPQSRYASNSSLERTSYNPIGVVGRVTTNDRFNGIQVVWSNGDRRNTYISDDHDLIAEGEPGFMEVT